jgi:hypothetical protein
VQAGWVVCETHSICLLEVEDKVQFTDVSKVPVQHLYISMYDLQRQKFVVTWGDGANKEKRGVTSVNDLGIYLNMASVHDVMSTPSDGD